MRIVDCHVHVEGQVEAGALLASMDGNGVHRILAMSEYERNSREKAAENLRQVQRLIQASPERIGGLAWINPAMSGAVELAEKALCDWGFSGIKIIPDHWFVYEERFEPFWEKLHSLSASVLFHTGILYAFDDGSRFCRPVYLEKLLHYPNIRFAMAHVSWPWCEECLAVMGRMQAAAREKGFEWQSYIDTTPGTPPHIREHAVRNAVDFCGPDRILFGSDSMIPGDLSHQKDVLSRDTALYAKLGLEEEQMRKIFSGNADILFPPR